MSHDSLLNYLKDRVDVSFEEEDLLKKIFKLKKFKKKEIITRKGEVCRFLYFLISGITRNYYINDAGKEVTRIVTFENKFFTNFLSFNNQVPSKEIIECIEDSELLYIDRDEFYKIITQVPITKQVFTLILLDSYSLHLERLEELNCMTPKERFVNMFNNQRELLFKLSNKTLASYLGISQETCSRLKKDVYR